MNLYLGGVFLVLLAGFGTLALKAEAKARLLSLGCAAGGLLILIPALRLLLHGGSETVTLPGGLAGRIDLVLDPLSAFFLTVIVPGAVGSMLYGAGYLKPAYRAGRTVSSHFVFLAVMTAAMLLLVAVRNALAFLVVWEIMSLASFFLVVFENEKPEVAAAGLNYLVTMHISVLFLIIGFALLSRAAGGALAFADFAAALKSRGDGFRTLVFLLF
ncbi:MAG: proton-conducting transporter membrane subunit, partial [Victivallaceae bacterium]|nr:proton-conducting transporter membrane subunit [Victivallaceae bacterium]